MYESLTVTAGGRSHISLDVGPDAAEHSPPAPQYAAAHLRSYLVRTFADLSSVLTVSPD